MSEKEGGRERKLKTFEEREEKIEGEKEVKGGREYGKRVKK